MSDDRTKTTPVNPMDALRERLGLPALPLPPEDAPTPPKHPCDTDKDEENER